MRLADCCGETHWHIIGTQLSVCVPSLNSVRKTAKSTLKWAQIEILQDLQESVYKLNIVEQVICSF